MALVCILLLIPLIDASRRFNEPSYRSNVMDGGKPILRMAPEADEVETDNSDEDRQPSPPERKASESAKNMNHIVNWLIDNFSYDLVVMGRKNNGLMESGNPKNVSIEAPDESDEPTTEKYSSLSAQEGAEPKLGENPNTSNESVAPDSEHEEDIVIQKHEKLESESVTESPVDLSEEPPVGSKETGLRTHKKNKLKEAKEDPEWVKDLKDFIKDLTTRYGQHEVLNKTKPVIASLEKKHHMKIKDIDVDEYGEIHITYLEKGKSNKMARQRKDTDDS